MSEFVYTITDSDTGNIVARGVVEDLLAAVVDLKHERYRDGRAKASQDSLEVQAAQGRVLTLLGLEQEL